jgi:quercetin dioxygenase-like cupin family protein
MAHAGQVFEPYEGFSLRLVQTAADTNGELLEMEATYPANSVLPPSHFHPQQAERFTVIEGRMRTVVDGIERVYEAGETFDVPAGAPHQMAAELPSRVRWEVRPALRTAEFFEGLYGDGPESAQVVGERFFERFGDEFQLAAS